MEGPTKSTPWTFRRRRHVYLGPSSIKFSQPKIPVVYSNIQCSVRRVVGGLNIHPILLTSLLTICSRHCTTGAYRTRIKPSVSGRGRGPSFSYKEGVTGSSPVSPTTAKPHHTSISASDLHPRTNYKSRSVTVLVTKTLGSCKWLLTEAASRLKIDFECRELFARRLFDFDVSTVSELDSLNGAVGISAGY